MSEFANTMRAMQGAIEGAQQELAKPETVDMIQRVAARHVRSEDTVKATLTAVQTLLENLRVTYEAEAARYRSKDPQSAPLPAATYGVTEYTSPESVWEAPDEPDDCNRCGFPHSGACNPDA